MKQNVIDKHSKKVTVMVAFFAEPFHNHLKKSPAHMPVIFC